MQAHNLKQAAVAAFKAWEYLRFDPMASRDQVEAARQKFLRVSAGIKGQVAPVLEVRK